MKDPTIPSADSRKKFMFYDTGRNQTELKVRLKLDKLNQSMFFRMMIKGYVENNENILLFIEDFKKEYKLEGRSHIKELSRSSKAAKDTKDKFGLNDGDIESFFDIMEEEYPEL